MKPYNCAQIIHIKEEYLKSYKREEIIRIR